MWPYLLLLATVLLLLLGGIWYMVRKMTAPDRPNLGRKKASNFFSGVED